MRPQSNRKEASSSEDSDASGDQSGDENGSSDDDEEDDDEDDDDEDAYRVSEAERISTSYVAIPERVRLRYVCALCVSLMTMRLSHRAQTDA